MLASLAVVSGCGRDETATGASGAAASSSPARDPSPSAADQPAADAVDPRLPGAAWQLRRTSTGAVIAEHQAARLRTAILPGSVAKIVTALAALDQGLGDERVMCTRTLTVHGRRLDCVHPTRAEPFDLSAALAHSCNTYFAHLGARLDRVAWQRLATRLGVPPGPADARAPLLAVGLEGPTATALVWRDVVLRALADSRLPLDHRRTIHAALQRAVSEGTAHALSTAWHTTLAKTGTAPDATGADGLAVVVRPEEDVDLIVRVRGAGRDAATVAAAVLATDAPGATTVRVGRRDGGPPDVMPLEAYVARVVAAEAKPEMAPAVLESLAIVARTYAMAGDGRHAQEGFDVCDSTHCQAVAPSAWPRAEQAATITSGTVLAEAGQIRAVHYSAACDGHLASATETWGGEAATWSLTGPEPFAHEIPRWRSTLPARALETALRDEGWQGDRLGEVSVDALTSVGRPLRVRLEGLRPADLHADRFRTIVGRHLGWDVMKSQTWRLTRMSDGYRLDGLGKGHGVGLCVSGAVTAASRQLDAGSILAAYFPRLTVRSLADTVVLRVSGPSQARAPGLLAQLYADLAGLRRRLSQGAPRQVEVIEHPSIEAYQRASGRAWWTGGSSRRVGPGAFRIDLPPLDVLARAGDVRRRLRHELVHVLTNAALVDAPLWAHEGLAVSLSGELAAATGGPDSGPDDRPDGGAGASCPSDESLARPGSAEAMQSLYKQAGRCAARALAGGAPWRALASPPDR